MQNYECGNGFCCLLLFVGKVEQKKLYFIKCYCKWDGDGAIWIILGVVNLFITAVVSISKKKNARIELLDGTRIPAFIIGMLLILMSKLFSV